MKAPRDQSIEALRILAAFGIVAFHSAAPGKDVSYAWLICFLILISFVDLKYGWERIRGAGQLARALLIPWVFWVAVYGVFNLLLHRPLFPHSFLGGTSDHLWFLPYAFLVLVLLNGTKRWVDPAILFWGAAVVAIALMMTVTHWRAASVSWPMPFGHWLHASAPVAVGVVLGLADRVKHGRYAILAVFAATWLAPMSDAKLAYVVGITLTVLVAMLGSRIWRWNVQPIASCMLGVYLVHIIWLVAITRFTGFGSYLTTFLIFAASLGSVWAARRILPASRAVLG